MSVSFFRAFFLMAALCLATGASCARTVGEADASTLVIKSSSGDHRFEVEIADTDEERTQGLMHRQSLGENAGMLFDFGPEPRPVSMWMKNTLISLDMAFIRADGSIARIEANTTPRSLASVRSGEDVVGVLEVNGGRLASLGVKAGDLVIHPMFGGR